jgi:hypothetical protein
MQVSLGTVDNADKRCCGFGMIILDPDFFIPDSGTGMKKGIGSRIRNKEKTKVLPSSRKYDPGCPGPRI